jgi:hypothetical protein
MDVYTMIDVDFVFAVYFAVDVETVFFYGVVV